MKDSLKIKWIPRRINLEVDDINKISPLYEAEALEDFQGEKFHKKGAKLNINHMIETEKYGQIMFISPNPIEFYLFGAKQSLNKIIQSEIIIENQLFKNNHLLFEMMSFFMYLYSSLEALVNQKIPKNISYKKKFNILFLKKDIEKKLSIEEKIKKILKIHVNDIKYWQEFLDFIELRHEVVHLKTATEESDFKSYDLIYKRLLNFDYKKSFENIKDLMKIIYEH